MKTPNRSVLSRRAALAFGITASALFAPAALTADTLSSAATGSAVWGTGGNWFDGSAPLAADDVVIDYSNGASATVLGLNATQAANSITFGSGNGTALGAFSLRANTSGTSGRSLTLTTGNVTVDSTVAGNILLGEAGFGTLTIALDPGAAGYSFTNNSTSRSLTVLANLSTTGKALTFADAGGGITFDTQLLTPTYASISGGASTTVITNGAASGTKTITLNSTSGTTTYSGSITNGASASIALTKSGIGAEQILTGANNYSGTTTISGGTLTLAGTNAGTGATTLNNSAATLNINNSGALASGLLSLTANGVLDNTSGAAITSQANNPAIFFSNFIFGTSAITDSSHDLNLGTGAVSYSGSGSPAFSFAGTGSTLTFGGVLSGQPGKTLGISGAGNTASFGGLIIGNGGAATQSQGFYGSANVVIEGTVSNAVGVTTGNLAYTGTAKLTLKGANTHTGVTSVAANGIINIQNSTALGTADGTTTTQTTVAAGGTLQLQGGITVGDERLAIVGTGATGTTGALQNVSGVNTYGGAIAASGSTTIASDAGTLNLTGAISVGGSSPMLRFTGAGDGNVTNSITQVNGTVSKTGTGTWTFSGTNSYGAQTSISEGTLKFAKAASLYNANTSLWTANNIRVASGGTFAINVGGTDEFTAGNVTTLLTNLASSSNATTNGMAAGSAIGFDTTNASGGTFTIADVIADTTGSAGGARGLTKLGTGTLILSGANTYTGATTVSAGTLLTTNSLGTSAISVASGAKFGGTGIANGAVTASAFDSVIIAGGVDSVGVLTLNGGLTANNGATFGFDIDGASIDSIDFGSAALNLGGTVTFDFTSLGSVETGVAYSLFAGTGDWSSISASFVINGPAGYELDTSYGDGNGYVFDDSTNSFTVQFVTSTVPEPSSIALLGGLGALSFAGLRRRRSRV